MSKCYILQKDWFFCAYDSSNGKTYKAGEKLRWCVDLPNFYELPDKVIVSAVWVENNPEWFLPEENKSNDSFQWTSELQEKYISILENELFKNGMLPESFRKTFVELNTPKPQAENKPDWEIVSCMGANKIIHPYDKRICLGANKNVVECTIHSVKRLSDGEVFSVGDDCWFQDYKFKIHKIYINEDGEMLVCSDFSAYTFELIHTHPPQPQKEEQREKLFTDESWHKFITHVIDEYLNTPKQEKYMFVDSDLVSHHSDKPQSATINITKDDLYKKEEQRIEVDVDLPLGITMREISSCITNYVRKSNEYPFLTDRETTVIDPKKLEEICKTKMRKMFTQQQIDAMCEDAFNAGRLRDSRFFHDKKFETYQDYKNSKQ